MYINPQNHLNKNIDPLTGGLLNIDDFGTEMTLNAGNLLNNSCPLSGYF